MTLDGNFRGLVNDISGGIVRGLAMDYRYNGLGFKVFLAKEDGGLRIPI